ncbi:hypothetical protein J45TS6_39190 [Paenibacillus sp. J45TS6]|uniref:hypothetical protein n=1 Tax=Paenibacillus sp. J45TS6 TaxID=2807196 RepID=UPI001B204743|nr:hypothetical protein [Paenibacillus sp. J45TS6]GIP45460.1 hypothetical protein J45TS6_39190 [Paenibacillus sp. J45TS6]
MKKAVYIFFLTILIVGCTQSISKSPETEPNSEADYINVGDKHYLNAWELALVDTTGISEIGKVERGSIILEGTPVFEISGYPEHNVVAVKADSNYAGLVTNTSGYLVYVLHEKDGKSHYPKTQDQQPKQIKIFSGSELLRELKGEDLSSFLVLFNNQGPHNEFHFEKRPEYTVLFIGDNALG